MKKVMERGFTLIELLVVIAIIGILAAVVLASLNDARSGGTDAAIQQSLGNARSQAEIVYNSNGVFSYAGVCEDAKIVQLATAAADSTGAGTLFVEPNTVAPSATNVSCSDSATAWAIQAPLATANSWCVDSTGVATRTATYMAADATVCP